MGSSTVSGLSIPTSVLPGAAPWSVRRAKERRKDALTVGRGGHGAVGRSKDAMISAGR